MNQALKVADEMKESKEQIGRDISKLDDGDCSVASQMQLSFDDYESY